MLITSFQPDLPSSVTTQLGTTHIQAFCKEASNTPEQDQEVPLNKQIYLFTPKQTPCPATPTRTLHSNMDTRKHPLFWGEGVMAVSTAQTAFVGFLPFKPKATITKNQKPLTFDKAFKFERGQEKVPRKGRETTFFKTFLCGDNQLSQVTGLYFSPLVFLSSLPPLPLFQMVAALH